MPASQNTIMKRHFTLLKEKYLKIKNRFKWHQTKKISKNKITIGITREGEKKTLITKCSKMKYYKYFNNDKNKPCRKKVLFVPKKK